MTTVLLSRDLTRLCDVAVQRIAVARSEGKLDEREAKAVINAFLDARSVVTEMLRVPEALVIP